jgi:hypothetical protein
MAKTRGGVFFLEGMTLSGCAVLEPQACFSKNLGILEFGNLGIWEFGNLGIWEFGNLEIWEFAKLGIWEFGN